MSYVYLHISSTWKRMKNISSTWYYSKDKRIRDGLIDFLLMKLLLRYGCILHLLLLLLPCSSVYKTLELSVWASQLSSPCPLQNISLSCSALPWPFSRAAMLSFVSEVGGASSLAPAPSGRDLPSEWLTSQEVRSINIILFFIFCKHIPGIGPVRK